MQERLDNANSKYDIWLWLTSNLFHFESDNIATKMLNYVYIIENNASKEAMVIDAVHEYIWSYEWH